MYTALLSVALRPDILFVGSKMLVNTIAYRKLTFSAISRSL